MVKIKNFYNIVIEVTRRCNMKCDHCLRGAAQPKDINPAVIDKLTKQADYISIITPTGGEPSINAAAIDIFLKKCKENNCSYGGFYIATNGKKYKDDFIVTIANFYANAQDQDVCRVEFSQSQWHRENGQSKHEMDKLRALRFVDDRHPLSYENLIDRGRAKKNGLSTRRHHHRDIIKPDEINLDDDFFEPLVYITVDGDVILGDCDLSYVQMKRKSIGNILQDDLSYIIERYALKRHAA